jgi:hypothetical protein
VLHAQTSLVCHQILRLSRLSFASQSLLRIVSYSSFLPQDEVQTHICNFFFT